MNIDLLSTTGGPASRCRARIGSAKPGAFAESLLAGGRHHWPRSSRPSWAG